MLAITKRLNNAVGAGGFDLLDASSLLSDYEDEDEDAGDAALTDDDPLIHSPLECTVSRAGATLRVFIYRGRSDASWILEVEDQLGGSTVWDASFPTDQAAFDAAMLAIEEDGIESFTASERV